MNDMEESVSLHPFEGPRGLKGFTRFNTSYGEVVSLQESSATVLVGQGVVASLDRPNDPQYAWLGIALNGHTLANAHISRENALELMLALSEFLTDEAIDTASVKRRGE